MRINQTSNEESTGQHTNDRIVRYELAVFGLERILQLSTTKILEIERKMLLKAWKLAKKMNEVFEEELDEMYDTMPEYYFDRSYEVSEDYEETEPYG